MNCPVYTPRAHQIPRTLVIRLKMAKVYLFINDAIFITVNRSMLFDEILGTFILEVSALAVTDPQNAFPPGMGPYLVGLSATAIGLAFGANSG